MNGNDGGNGNVLWEREQPAGMGTAAADLTAGSAAAGSTTVATPGLNDGNDGGAQGKGVVRRLSNQQ